MPLVSVLLPVYNGERYLEVAVRSILSQTFRDFEFLILNDGSTDRTASILTRLSREDARIQVFSRENRGLVISLNELLEKAEGRYCARMDADDIALPCRLDAQVTYFQNHPEVVLLGGQIELIDAATRLLGVLGQPLTHREIEGNHLCGHTSICHPAAMFDRIKALGVGGYQDAFFRAEDLDLWLRLGEIGPVANLAVTILMYRIHGKSISGSNQKKQVETVRRVCQAAWERRGLKGQYVCQSAAWREEGGWASRHRFSLKYGWMAWKHGHETSARSYAWQAILTNPFSVDSWRLYMVTQLRRGRSVGKD